MILNAETQTFVQSNPALNVFTQELTQAIVNRDLELTTFMYYVEKHPLLCVLIRQEDMPLDTLIGDTLFGFEQRIQNLDTCVTIGLCEAAVFDELIDNDTEENREKALFNTMT